MIHYGCEHCGAGDSDAPGDCPRCGMPLTAREVLALLELSDPAPEDAWTRRPHRLVVTWPVAPSPKEVLAVTRTGGFDLRPVDMLDVAREQGRVASRLARRAFVLEWHDALEGQLTMGRLHVEAEQDDGSWREVDAAGV